jgi:transcriptional regulator with GAF, ATPase, and Fis domain
VDDADYAALLRRTMAELTETASHPRNIGTTLRGVTAACVELIPGTDSADILVINNSSRYESIAPTSELPKSLDGAQQQFGEGPCVNAAVGGDAVVRCDDLREDARWPRFAKAAVVAGVHSMLSFQLFTHDDRVAALNIVGLEPDCFGQDAEALGAMFATHAALALIAHDKQSQFESALASRDIIGQAKGRIMERFNVDAVHAFELLVKLSQDSNTRLTEIAAQIVARGSDPQGREVRWHCA